MKPLAKSYINSDTICTDDKLKIHMQFTKISHSFSLKFTLELILNSRTVGQFEWPESLNEEILEDVAFSIYREIWFPYKLQSKYMESH